jgi:hypothetical protein
MGKTAVREMYESSVQSAWIAFDELEGQIYLNYTDASLSNKLEPNDKTYRDKNMALVKNADALYHRLEDLWEQYQKTSDGGYKMKSIFIRTIKLAPVNYVPLLEDGRFLTSKIHSRSIVQCYQDIAKFFEGSGLFYRKFHRGARVLIAEGDPLGTELFTTSPYEPVKV